MHIYILVEVSFHIRVLSFHHWSLAKQIIATDWNVRSKMQNQFEIKSDMWWKINKLHTKTVDVIDRQSYNKKN